VAASALVPVALLAIAFPEGGVEPFAFGAFLPLPLLAIGALWAVPREMIKLRVGIVLYTLGTILAYLIPTAVGSNAARLGTFMAAPLAALVWWPARARLLAASAVPLLYIGWHDAVTDVTLAVGQPSVTDAFYQPLLGFLGRQPGPPFRTEIPFTSYHWEAYAVARKFPLARGWERQLDIADNPIFYHGPLTPATYEAWLQNAAVRFVAVAKAPLDYSARAEVALIDRGLPYLKLVWRTPDWRVYSVEHPTPIVQGDATLRALGADWLELQATRAGTALVHVHFTPYWALAQGSGCVAPAGDMTKVTMREPGPVRLVTRFSVGRIRASSPRCT
jgi:hypothetical protein